MNQTALTPDTPTPTPLPRQSRIIKGIADPIYRFFDWLYGSEFNPLYRSGTLAVGFLFVLLITGLYLCFFYSVSQPYESLVVIQEQKWIGRWVRTLHRYATVATVFAIAFHVLQLLAQGKSWGPRTLAWVSGIALTVMFFLSAWSGYVMVWDLHGQRVAIAGAEMLSLVPMLREVVTAAFDGTTEIPPGFFFMNLFLHVALPLLMIIFLWVHTARLSRAVWFPRHTILVWSVIGLIGISLLWPAPLLEKANLHRLIGQIPIDLSTGFWMPWPDYIGTAGTWVLLAAALVLCGSIPWWWRPPKDARRPISAVDATACTGCMQCTRDCPYEAIKMVPRPDGKRLIAEIIPSNCVSCGICAASCADFAIGPPGRSAVDQRARVRSYCAALGAEPRGCDLVLIACANNPGLFDLLHEFKEAHAGVSLYPVECCGCIHSEVLEEILKVSKRCALIGCPARNCFNRDGGDLLAQRVFEKRVPFLDRSIDRNRILIASYSEAEEQELRAALEAFYTRSVGGKPPQVRAQFTWRHLRATITSILLLALCAFAAQTPVGSDPSHALIRVAGSLASFAAEECRIPTEAELASIPQHMRPKEICERTPLAYQVKVSVDDEVIVTKSVGGPDIRVDKPLFLDLEVVVSSGRHEVEVSIESADRMDARCEKEITLMPGEIFLAHFQRLEQVLRCGEATAAGKATEQRSRRH